MPRRASPLLSIAPLQRIISSCPGSAWTRTGLAGSACRQDKSAARSSCARQSLPYLTDENVPQSILTWLRATGHDVSSACELGIGDAVAICCSKR